MRLQSKKTVQGRALRCRLQSLVVTLGAIFSWQTYATTQTLRYDDRETMNFPEGCNTAFQEVSRFVEFFEASASMLVAKRGPQSRGAIDLFTVLGLRDELAEMGVNYSVESPVDRLVIAQLCQYQKIRVQQRTLGGKMLVIEPGEEALMDHLAAVSGKLLADAKAIVLEFKQNQGQEKERNRFLASKRSEIEEARAAGRRKAQSLIR